MGQVVSGEREKKLNENILGNSNKCFRGRKSNSKRERRKTGTSATPAIRSLRLRDGNKVVRFNSLRRNFKRATRKTLFSRRPLIASDSGRHMRRRREKSLDNRHKQSSDYNVGDHIVFQSNPADKLMS